MRWTYKTSQERFEEQTCWHRVFAWWPIFDEGEVYWLESVEREWVPQRFLGRGFWQYRPIEHITDKDYGELP